MTVALSEPKKLNRRERKAERARITTAIEQARPISLVASAATVRVSTQWANMRWGGTDWQQEGWMHYDTCPEFHSGVELKANALGRARLIGVDIDPDSGEPRTQPTENADVRDIMGMLFGGPTGQSQALTAMGRHLSVAGDLFVLATDQPDADQTTWEILGTTEVTAQGNGRINVTQLDGLPRPVDTDNELLFRVWQPHPSRRWDADSMARPLLPVLRELASLTAMVSATVKSRLASAGILWLPDELSVPTTSGPVVENSQVRTEAAGANAWLDLITEAMTAPIQDPDSAAAVVPLVATVKGDLIEKISHMEFGRDLDAMIEPLRTAGVSRLAVGMSLPAEYLNGQGDINHWTGWLIAEDFNRLYLAPVLELIADALTRYYLRPALRARGIDPDLFAVYFDLTALQPQQISVANAQAAYDAGLLKESEYMAVLGFSPAQMADNMERGRRLIVQLVQTQPDSLAALVPVLTQMFPGAPHPVVPALPAAPIRETVSVPDPGAAGDPAAAVPGPPGGAGSPPPPPPALGAPK